MAHVNLRNVGKYYGAVEVLHDINLSIAVDEFVVLVWQSGCGKSTLLQMDRGLEEISRSDIETGDRRVNDLPPSERDIATVFQSCALCPNLTEARYIAFSFEMRGAKPRSGVAFLGIRPVNAGIGVAGIGQTGKAAVLEPSGADVHITLMANEAPFQVVTPERLNLADRAEVSLTAAPQRAHVFDLTTGSRLIN